ncbi:MAG: TRAP transporter small permease [Burkholderiales bacterium]|jgi:TRAP-type C4-dicarboxylate transport system permease small subunit|nr:TRAP transporter small permease [Burkholderiales bacterium]
MTKEREAEEDGSAARGALERAAGALALLGGAMLVAITLMSVASITGRWLFGKPLMGDFELVQLGAAVAIASFLPFTQLQRNNIIVDFFTAKLNPSLQAVLDAFGSLLLAAMLALFAWRTAVGAATVKAAGETSMIMGVPLWYGYALMVPGLVLTVLVAIRSAVQDWKRV